MGNVSIYQSKQQVNAVALSDVHLLQLTNPSHKVKFVKNGEDVHLLVYLHDCHDLPFMRVPVEILLNSAREYERKHPF
jgi:hypothetical protein